MTRTLNAHNAALPRAGNSFDRRPKSDAALDGNGDKNATQKTPANHCKRAGPRCNTGPVHFWEKETRQKIEEI